MVGLVNFSMQTLYARDEVAFLVVTGYMLCTCAIPYILHKHNITIKFW